MRRIESRWRTRLGRWVASVGVEHVAREVGVNLYGQPLHVSTVYQWVSATRVPRLPHAVAVARLSAGKLTVADILDHREQMQRRRQTTSTATRP